MILTDVVGGQAPQSDGPKDSADTQSTQALSFGALLSQVPDDIRDVSFATAVRGYDRREVDGYVERVNRVIAELEVSRSPQSAVKHALDRVGEQTSGVLQRAREVAEDLTATALAEADHLTRRAKVEAEEAVEGARTQADQLRAESKQEADEILARASSQAKERLERAEDQVRMLQEEAQERLRALHQEIEAAASARRDLLEELRRTASRLDQFAQGMASAPQETDRGEPQHVSPTERVPRRPAPRTRQAAARDGNDATADQRAVR